MRSSEILYDDISRCWWVTADIELNGYFLNLTPPNPPYNYFEFNFNIFKSYALAESGKFSCPMNLFQPGYHD
jgi:hypothetical protein